MRATVKELMDKLGVGFVPGAYETVPWSHYDGETGQSCSAEVRMGMDSDEVEGEIQMLYDTPPEGKGPMEQICFLKGVRQQSGDWTITDLRIRNAPFGQDIYDWEGKSCDFFQSVVSEIKLGRIPDIDELIEECFHKRERFADQVGGGGGKSPTIRTDQVLGIKNGRGF